MPDQKSAYKLASTVVKNSLASCVQRIKIISTYTWKGKIENTHEILLIMKTRRKLARNLMKFIKSYHPYETPEIVTINIDSGLTSYIEWIYTTTHPYTKSK